jgi:hypothetical protein
MENIILSSLMKSDEYTINQMCKSSKEIRQICKMNKNALSKKIIIERIENISSLSLEKVKKLAIDKYNGNYSKMLLDWKKWGRSRKVDISDDSFDDEACDECDELANLILNKPKNEIYKKSLSRGDIVVINNHDGNDRFPPTANLIRGKFVYNGSKLENLEYVNSRSFDRDEEEKRVGFFGGRIPKNYLAIDEFHIKFWEETIDNNTFVPVKIPNIKLERKTDNGEAIVYSFVKNDEKYYLLIFSQEEDITNHNISFENVNYYQTDVMSLEHLDRHFPEFSDLREELLLDGFFLFLQITKARKKKGKKGGKPKKK